VTLQEGVTTLRLAGYNPTAIDPLLSFSLGLISARPIAFASPSPARRRLLCQLDERSTIR